ncbi:MAG TPA: VOC family protein [Gemmatimonadaceae bacterium]|nr:VOC family protein [Gemmatimonadaceae bacterium]
MANAPRDLGIQYIELGVRDVAAAKRFYGDAFGWTFTDYGPTYASFGNAAVDGGFNGEDQEMIGRPLVILYANDLEASLARVERAGGQVVKPIFSFPGGRRFHFTDPAGNELAIWSDK